MNLLVGKSIACSGRGPPRVCDAFGVQLGLATLNDRAHGNCHDDIFSRVIGDALHAGLRGKEEPREIFSAVIPPVTLNGTAGTRGKNGIVPDGRLHCKLRESRTARCTGTRGQAHPSVRWRGTTVGSGGPSRVAVLARCPGTAGDSWRLMIDDVPRHG